MDWVNPIDDQLRRRLDELEALLNDLSQALPEPFRGRILGRLQKIREIGFKG